MSNPPRRKGTKWESLLLPLLRHVFGQQVERAPLKGTQDRGDFTGLPGRLMVEAKNTKTLCVPEWARRLNKMGPDWVIAWSGGDRRKADCPGPLAIMPLDTWLELEASLEEQQGRYDRG
jgi:hypothetical protein